ncbi:MAG: endolytic transglycosylase MltG [Patescibacteria group bacterium]|nr:endolytic transglycosylase MltG [Patescibacteria group bacterium]
MKQKKSKWLLRILLILGIIFLVQNTYYYLVERPADKEDDTKILFTIKKGQSASTVGDNLEDAGLIWSDTVFSIYTRQNGIAEKIIAGRFYLNKTMDLKQIASTITDPSKAESIITIQEGLTVKDIDAKLVEMDMLKEGKFVEAVKNFNGYEAYDFLDKETLSKLEIPLEGYLFPDTYFLDPSDFTGEQLITKALNNFHKKLEEKPENLHEVITMASIIEREVRTDADRPIVSGILWKRYLGNWHLGADATLLYITDDNKIDTEDLAIDSPYNTRKVVGIPPGPIGNPGMKSIEAAISPQESPYWYYLTTPDTGEVIYAKDNDEHNSNKAKYLY